MRWLLKTFAKLLAVGFLLGLPAAARAGVLFCSDHDETMDVARGANNGSYWQSDGWFTVAPGQCITIYGGNYAHSEMYFYAQTASGKVWRGSDADPDAAPTFCIAKGQKFDAVRRDSPCPPNFETVRFFRANVSGGSARVSVGNETQRKADLFAQKVAQEKQRAAEAALLNPKTPEPPRNSSAPGSSASTVRSPTSCSVPGTRACGISCYDPDYNVCSENKICQKRETTCNGQCYDPAFKNCRDGHLEMK